MQLPEAIRGYITRLYRERGSLQCRCAAAWPCRARGHALRNGGRTTDTARPTERRRHGRDTTSSLRRLKLCLASGSRHAPAASRAHSDAAAERTRRRPAGPRARQLPGLCAPHAQRWACHPHVGRSAHLATVGWASACHAEALLKVHLGGPHRSSPGHSTGPRLVGVKDSARGTRLWEKGCRARTGSGAYSAS